MLVAAIMGQRGLNTLLVASQVILSFVLPFVAFPLIWVTSNPKLMTVQEEVVVVGSALESEKAEVEVVERTETRYIDHSNGKIMMGLGYLIWLVVLIANTAVLSLQEDICIQLFLNTNKLILSQYSHWCTKQRNKKY